MGISFAVIKVVVMAMVIVLPLLLLIVRKVRHGSIMVPSSSVIVAAALLPIMYGLSTFFATDKNTALLGFNFNTDSLVVVLLGFLALLLTILLSVRKSTGERIYKAVLYVTGAVVVTFLVQIAIQMFGLELPVSMRLLQWVGSWLDVAACAGLLVIFLLEVRKGLEERVERAHTLCIVFVAALMLFLGIFTNITLVFALLALVAGIKLVQIIRMHGWIAAKAGVILPMIVLAMSVFFIGDNTLLDSKVSNTVQGWTKISFIDVRPNWQGTLDVAKGTVMDANTTAKLFGPGAGSFSEQWRIHKPVGVNATQFWSTNFNNAIGFIPTSIITGGAVVFVAWSIFLLVMLVAVVRSRASALGLATLFIWIFAVLNPIDTLVLIIAFVITGLFVADMARVRLIRVVNYKLRGEGMNKVVAYVVVPVVLLSSIFVALTVAHRSIVNSYLIKASNTMIAGHMNDAERLLNKAKRFTDTVLIEQGYTRVALAQLSTLLQENSKDGVEIDQAVLQAALANVLSHARRAIERDPGNPTNYIALGTISEQLIPLQIQGAAESALESYSQAFILDSKNPSIPFAMARVYGAMENVEEVTKALEVSLALKNNYEPALYQYGLLKLSQGDTQAAIQALGTVVQINQNNANALYYLSLTLIQEERIEDAIVVMRRVSVLNPDNEKVKQIITTLEQQIKDGDAPLPVIETMETEVEDEILEKVE